MRILVRLLLATAAAALCGCSVMESTAIIAPLGDRGDSGARDGGAVVQARDAVDDVSCRGKLGAYFLTKRLVKIRLERTGEFYALYSGRDPGKTSGNDAALSKLSTDEASGLVTVADRERGYCLEFLESQTSEDNIEVERDSAGFLKTITSDTQDKSKEIAGKVIDTVFRVITGNPNFDPTLKGTGTAFERTSDASAVTETLLDATYDPADPAETALINERLTQYGFCLILEGQPPVAVEDRQRYCNNPTTYSHRGGSHARPGAASRKPLVQEHERMAPGIYYRPRRPYAYSVLINPDATCDTAASPDACSKKYKEYKEGKWTLREEKTIELENLSPVVAIRVDRTFFAQRKTTIKFDNGVLYDVRIRKDSELAGFVEIPLQIARSIVAIPGNIVKVRIDNTQSRTRLVAAQMLLLDQQRKHIEALSAIAEGK